MTRKGFDLELNRLHNDIVKMGNITERQIYDCIEALVEQDEELADNIIKNDDIVDALEWEIEDRCVKLIAKEQPMAIDLRTIITSTKIATDLERMADHAVDIAKVAKRLKNEKYIKELIDIPRMAETVREMIKKSLEAFIDNDVDKSYVVCKMDDEIDAIYKSIFNELLPIMSKKPEAINQCTQFLFVCKFLERIGDHVTNICEWIIYAATGERKDLNE